MAVTVGCVSCEYNEQLDVMPQHERIAVDELWRVAHIRGTPLPGWLVLLPRRHVATIAELTDAEAATLGLWQVRLSRALRAVTGCAKTYVVQFAEAEGFSHVHFHVIPRMADLPPEDRGPNIFRMLGVATEHQIDGDQMDAMASAVASALDSATKP